MELKGSFPKKMLKKVRS